MNKIFQTKKCEWHEHEGDPYKNHGEGIWWLKDPEWVVLCPNCNTKYKIKMFKKIEEEVIKKQNYSKTRESGLK